MDRNSSDAPYDVEPGLCVIINNMDFTQAASLPGGKKDEEKLLLQFTALGFVVRVHRNLTGKEISDTVKSYGTREHSGAFFLAISSHGTSIDNKPAVTGTDGEAVLVQDLESFFHASNCNSLHGKPKIFLIDACRGSRRERIFNPVPTSGMTTRNSSASLRRLRRPDSITIRSDSVDFLIIYAATDGHVAFTTDEGSYLTQTFVKGITKADETDSFLDIVTRVTKQVQDRNPHQTVESTVRLTRKYLIKSNTPMLTIQEWLTIFDAQVRQWIPVYDITIEEIEKTIKKLKELHRNINIARITGSSASVAGSFIAILGFGLAPVTFGGSIALSVGGIALAVAGGGTAAGASTADTFLQRSNVKHAQDQLDSVYKQLRVISQIARDLKQEIDDVRQKCPGVSDAEFAAIFVEVVAQGVSQATNLALRLAELSTLDIDALESSIGGAAAQRIDAARTVLSMVLIPIDMTEIIRSSVSLARGPQTKAIKQLTDTVEQLKKQKAAIEYLLGRSRVT